MGRQHTRIGPEIRKRIGLRFFHLYSQIICTKIPSEGIIFSQKHISFHAIMFIDCFQSTCGIRNELSLLSTTKTVTNSKEKKNNKKLSHLSAIQEGSACRRASFINIQGSVLS